MAFQFTLAHGVRKLFQMLRASLILAGWLVTLNAFAELPPQEDLFQKGLAAYQNKDFNLARDNFQKILVENQANLSVLHNLALTEYQLQQRAMAIALWRKALWLDPSYTPARQGRSYLESKYNVQGFERTSFQRSWRRFLESVSIIESSLFLALLIGVAGILWIRFLGLRRQALDEDLPLPKWPWLAFVFSLATALSGTILMGQIQSAAPQRATIITSNSSLRSLPTEDSVQLLEIPGGVEVLVRRHDKDWTQVQNSEGSTGWVKNSEILITSGWDSL